VCLQLAVIIAMSAVRMVQMAIHQVINVVAMRNGFVAAVRTVSVGFLMGCTAVVRRTFVRIRSCHLNVMVVHMIAVSVMQMAIMKIIGVAGVFHCGVPAVCAMHMAVSPRVLLVSVSHMFQSFRKLPLIVAPSEWRQSRKIDSIWRSQIH
jgi:hypothetical protein